jgi:hypothetical protein
VVVRDDDVSLTVICPKTILSPGEVMTCTATGTAIVGQYVNSADVSALPQLGVEIQANDVSHYFGVEPTDLPEGEQPNAPHIYFLPRVLDE